MLTNIIRIGNSNGVRISASLLKSLGWRESDSVKVTTSKGQIIIDKIDKSPFAAISSGGWYDDERDPHEISDEIYKGRINTRTIEIL